MEKTKLRSIDIKPRHFVENLLIRAHAINEEEVPPNHTSTCQDCELLERLTEIAMVELDSDRFQLLPTHYDLGSDSPQLPDRVYAWSRFASGAEYYE